VIRGVGSTVFDEGKITRLDVDVNIKAVLRTAYTETPFLVK
jgi:hypothetical protein